MHKHTDTTPCPGAVDSSHARRVHRVSFANDPRGAPTDTTTTSLSLYGGDSTENITFTTDLPRNFIDVRPKRRPIAAGARRRGTAFKPELDIWTELGQDEEAQAISDERRQQGMATSGSAFALARVLADPRKARRSSAVFEKQPGRTYGTTVPVNSTLNHAGGQQQQAAGLDFTLPPPKRSRRLSSVLEGQPKVFPAAHKYVASGPEGMISEGRRRDSTLHKDPRRRSIFIQSDNTATINIPPRQHDQRRRERSPDLGMDLVTLSEEDTQDLTNIVPRIVDDEVRSRGPRKSLAVKPKRVPLQPSTRGEANVNEVRDVLGQGHGKENVPPGMRIGSEKTIHLDVKHGPADIIIHFDDTVPLTKSHHQPRRDTIKDHRRMSSVNNGSATTKKRSGSDSLHQGEAARASKSRHSILPAKLEAPIMGTGRRSTIGIGPSAVQPTEKSANSLADLRLSTFKNSARTVGKLPLYYPVITEDLVEPELYEDRWLGRQEIALGQLLNHLLQTKQLSHANPGAHGSDLRRRMLSLYQGTEFVLAHKRLKASLEFGALAIPRDMIAQVSRLGNDLGLRRRFISMWTYAYDLSTLKYALETVVGREVVLPKRLSASLDGTSEEEQESKKLCRGIERFIEIFLIRQDDAQPPSSSGSLSISSIARNVGIQQSTHHSQSWIWRRTMLRSLMLILLLDRAKSTGAVQGCLFQRSSERKSSVAVVHALASLLFPSLGDVVRPLAHLGYRVTHVQYPLEEYEYKVDNLATALRDGILLARVVEILLAHPHAAKKNQAEETMTIAMPSGEMLQSILKADEQDSWALSQHLKLPCMSRAQRLFNVQISLGALRSSSRGVSRALDNITAVDVVDGHREKSLGLLWSLVGRLGLEWLVDWPALRSEVNMIRKNGDASAKADLVELHQGACSRNFSDGSEDAFEQQLLLWAQAIARKCGIEVSNLTTSFADGKVIEAIVDEYIDHFPTAVHARSNSTSTSSRSAPPTISAKLKRIGCSTSFVSLFLPSDSASTVTSSSPIPSKPFVVMTLAYLASRLVPQTAAHRAASVIQRCYRSHLARRTMVRRVMLMRIATDCATVVNTRARVVDAACLLQRAWRVVLERRMGKLVGDVVKIQSSARGWAMRLALKGGGIGQGCNGW